MQHNILSWNPSTSQYLSSKLSKASSQDLHTGSTPKSAAHSVSTRGYAEPTETTNLLPDEASTNPNTTPAEGGETPPATGETKPSDGAPTAPQGEKPEASATNLLEGILALGSAMKEEKDPQDDPVGVIQTNMGTKAIKIKETHPGEWGNVEGEDGRIYGQINKDGWFYSAQDDTQWNIFQQPSPIMLGFYGIIGHSALALRLNHRAVEIARENSFRPWISHEIHKGLGITGNGVSVMAIDGKIHGQLCNNQINGGREGIAPNASFTLNQFGFEGGGDSDLPQYYDEVSLKQYAISSLLNDMDILRQTMLEISQLDSPPDILLMALGSNRASFYTTLVDDLMPEVIKALDEDRFAGEIKDPTVKTLIDTWQRENVTDTEKWQSVVNFIDSLEQQRNELHEFLPLYYEALGKLDEAGVTVILSSGNERQDIPPGVTIRDNTFTNFLGGRPNVVTVAASYPNGTPGYFGDDVIASFSNPGANMDEADPYQPTVTAPGMFVPVDWGISDIGISAWDGTSASAAWVAGVAALVKEANPDLTAQELKQVLEASCENPRNLSFNDVGYGFINPVKAVKLALQPLPSQTPSIDSQMPYPINPNPAVFAYGNQLIPQPWPSGTGTASPPFQGVGQGQSQVQGQGPRQTQWPWPDQGQGFIPQPQAISQPYVPSYNHQGYYYPVPSPYGYSPAQAFNTYTA